MKTFLSVNVNKIATLRNSRGGNNPNPLDMVERLISYGVRGITIHPRPDERHIKRQDVYELKNYFSKISEKIEFNIEGYPSEDFLKMCEEVAPQQVTYVPDPPHVLTSNAGWKFKDNLSFLRETVERTEKFSRSSLFLDPLLFTPPEAEALFKIKPARIELYTEEYAKAFSTPQREWVVGRYKEVADKIAAHGLGINAGHDLDTINLEFFLKTLGNVKEVSIGHALICDALIDGLEVTVKKYLSLCD